MWTGVITLIIILLVLTNDFHMQVFHFHPGFENWDEDYSHRFVFTLLTVWQYVMYFAGVLILLHKCRRSGVKNHAFLILIPFVSGVISLFLLFFDKFPKYNGTNILEFPEVNGFMVAGILECCMSLGLIPTNERHRDLMRISSVSAQITDKSEIAVYKSAAAADLPPDVLMSLKDAMIDENTLLRKKEIPGGYGFWQEDISELNSINKALADAKEKLSEENNLIRLQNDLRERQKKIEHRIHIYDEIARRTVEQSKKISLLSENGLKTNDYEEKDRIKKPHKKTA